MRSVFLFIKRIAAIVGNRFLSLAFILVPEKKNIIVFDSYRGSQYSCSPRAIYEYLLQHYADELEFVWLFKNVEPFKFLLENKNTTICKRISFRHAYYSRCAGVIIINGGSVNRAMPANKHQIQLSTWHGGGAYKKTQTAIASNSLLEKWMFEHIRLTHMISSSRYFSEEVVPEQLCFHGPILEIGLPRNDIFFDKDRETAISKKVRNQYDLADSDYLILYAPTYRDYVPGAMENVTSEIDLDSVANVVSSLTCKHVTILFRGHYYVSSHPSISCLDVTDYPDMQDLLCAADMLITDYSSSMWDFSFTGKPCFLFVPDLADYLTYRGLDTDIHTWGFPVCETNDELIAAIENFDPEAYAAAMQRHHDTLGSFERGTATKEVAEFIMEHVRKK